MDRKLKSFKQFRIDESKTGRTADFSGKLFELAFAKHLSHQIHGEKGDIEDHHPTHFRDEFGKSPREVHERLAEELGPDQVNKIHNHAKKAASNFIKYLRDKHNISLNKEDTTIAWTSNPTDPAKFTGNPAARSAGDVMLRSGGKHIAISLKYGGNPGLKNPGIDTMSTLLKTPHLQNLIAQHASDTGLAVQGHLTGPTKSEKHKEFKTLSPEIKNPVLDISREYHKRMASHAADAFNNNLNDEERHDLVRTLLHAHPEEGIDHSFRVHQNTTTRSQPTHISEPSSKWEETHSDIVSHVAEASGKQVNLHGIRRNGEKIKLGSFGFKNKGSSPFSGDAVRVGPAAKALQ